MHPEPCNARRSNVTNSAAEERPSGLRTMHIVILIAIVTLIFGAIELGFIPPFNARILLRMRGGSLIMEKGRLQGNAATHVESILRGAGVSDGFVAMTGGQRVYFSRQIPADVHQRLRNVLLNQWR
jgi:hypothetical protein